MTEFFLSNFNKKFSFSFTIEESLVGATPMPLKTSWHCILSCNSLVLWWQRQLTVMRFYASTRTNLILILRNRNPDFQIKSTMPDLWTITYRLLAGWPTTKFRSSTKVRSVPHIQKVRSFVVICLSLIFFFIYDCFSCHALKLTRFLRKKITKALQI